MTTKKSLLTSELGVEDIKEKYTSTMSHQKANYVQLKTSLEIIQQLEQLDGTALRLSKWHETHSATEGPGWGKGYAIGL